MVKTPCVWHPGRRRPRRDVRYAAAGPGDPWSFRQGANIADCRLPRNRHRPPNPPAPRAAPSLKSARSRTRRTPPAGQSSAPGGAPLHGARGSRHANACRDRDEARGAGEAVAGCHPPRRSRNRPPYKPRIHVEAHFARKADKATAARRETRSGPSLHTPRTAARLVSERPMRFFRW